MSALPVSDALDLRGSGEVVLWDWIVTGRWDRLHAPAAWSDPDYEAYDEDARTVCGLRGSFCIPGVFTRMGGMRCARCCRSTGLPPGCGSPKNDDALRPLVEAQLLALREFPTSCSCGKPFPEDGGAEGVCECCSGCSS